MRGIAAVGIHDDLAARQARIPFRTAHDKAPGGVDEVLGLPVQEVRRDGGPHDALDQVAADGLLVRVRAVLGGQDDGVHAHGLAVQVFHGDLALSIRAQVGQLAALADLAQAAGQAVGQGDGHGHELLGLVAGKAEHHALVARADVHLALGAALERVADAHGDVRGLLVQLQHHAAGRGVKAAGAVAVADVGDGLADDRFVVHIGLGGDFAHDQHEVGRGDRLAGDAGHGVLGQVRVQDRVGDLVADLVGVSLRDGLGGKESLSLLQHVLHPFCVFPMDKNAAELEDMERKSLPSRTLCGRRLGNPTSTSYFSAGLRCGNWHHCRHATGCRVSSGPSLNHSV